MKIPSALLPLVCSVLSLSPLHAVVVQNGNAANLVAPVDDPGWDAIGTISAPAGPATAIFLGNNGGYGWFLTANHVSLTSATLSIGGIDYTAFLDVDQIGTTDMKVFRVNAIIPAITPVTLASATPAVGLEVVMAGFGATGTFMTWDTNTGPWTSPGAGASGYTWTVPNVKRWGTNMIHETGSTVYSPNLSIITDFDDGNGEAQATLGDSGGAMFYKNGMNWELIGLMVAVAATPDGTNYINAFVGQPGSTSVSFVNGNPSAKSVTFAVQISEYRSEILQAIPEVSSLGLLALASLLLARRSSVRR